MTVKTLTEMVKEASAELCRTETPAEAELVLLTHLVPWLSEEHAAVLKKVAEEIDCACKTR